MHSSVVRPSTSISGRRISRCRNAGRASDFTSSGVTYWRPWMAAPPFAARMSMAPALGLAHGQGAEELEAAAVTADAVQREADRAAGVDRDGPEEDGGEADADGRAADPAAIAALASDIQGIVRKRDQLAEELAGLDRQRAELQAKLMGLLGKAGVRPRPPAPAPPAPPPGEHLPKAAWRRPE